MRRFLLGTIAAIAASTPAYAQFRGGPIGPAPRGGPPMQGGFGAPAGGGFRMVQGYPLPRTSGFGLGVGLGTGYGLGGGYRNGYGYGAGGFIPGGYGYGYDYAPYYFAPQAAPAPIVVGSAPAVPAEPSGAAALSGFLPATLVLQYPAAAKVWLNGVEVPGDADTSWTFTSRPLGRGDTATFRVRGRWVAGGKTFESEREVSLASGARSRLLVVSGNEVKE